MLHLLTQLRKELQLNLKTNNTQNCQKIKLYGSLTTKDLKKPHSSRRVGGEKMQRPVERGVACRGGGTTGSPNSLVVNKNWEEYLGSQKSQPQAGPHSPGIQCQEDKS